MAYGGNGSEDKKKNKSSFSAWFGASLEEEFGGQQKQQQEQDLEDQQKRHSALVGRRQSAGAPDKRISPFTASQVNQKTTRKRSIPLRRGSSDSDQLPLGDNKMKQKQQRPPNPRRESSGRFSMDGMSAQSSITNSWVPKMRPYYPPMLFPHKPLENMVITVKGPVSSKSNQDKDQDDQAPKGDDTTNSTVITNKSKSPVVAVTSSRPKIVDEVHDADDIHLIDDDIHDVDLHPPQDAKQQQQGAVDLQSLALSLTEEQKAEVEQYVFRGWGDSDDDGKVFEDNDDENNEQQQATTTPAGWLFGGLKNNTKKESEQNPDSASITSSHKGEVAVRQPRPRIESIDAAMRELQALTGMEVRCLDEIGGGDDGGGHSSGDDDKDERNDIQCVRTEQENQAATAQKSAWFFTNKQQTDLIKEDDLLAQPYALIRSQEDEERMKKHYQEEEKRKLEDEKKHIEEEKRKKKNAWFSFAKKEESLPEEEAVINVGEIADALDDLEIIAGETRVSQVKEARRHLERSGMNEAEISNEFSRFRPSALHDSRHGRRRLRPISRGNSAGEVEIGPEKTISPDMVGMRNLSERQKRSLSRFELPLGESDVDNTISPGLVGLRKLQNSLSRFELPLSEDEHSASEKGAAEFRSKSLHAISAVRHISKPITSTGVMRFLQEETEIDMMNDPAALVETKNNEAEEESIIDTHMSLPPKVSDLTKQALITDNEKRDARWRLNQMLVNNLFNSYHAAIAETDGDLPFEDDYQVYALAEESIDAQFRNVRNMLLEDGSLLEREIGSFFGGFALLTVKVRSLQSQLEAIQVVQRAEAEEQKVLNPSPETLLNDDMIYDTPRIQMIRDAMTDPKLPTETKRMLKELEVAEVQKMKLEKGLHDRGFSLPEYVPYDDSRGQVDRISQRIVKIRSSDPRHITKKKQAEHEEELAKLQADLKKYESAIAWSNSWVEREINWEAEISYENSAALRRIRRHMPVNVSELNENQLTIEKTPNGKLLPKRLAKKFKHTTILQLLRANPDAIDKMHPTTLENLRTDGLTLSERRALYAHMRVLGPKWRTEADDPTVRRKRLWFRMLKQQFKEALDFYNSHCEEFGPPENHPYASFTNPTEGCQLIGRQCPVKDDKLFDYGLDYGFPEGPVYCDEMNTDHTNSSPNTKPSENTKRMLLKKSLRRSDALRRHYKDTILQYAIANSCCEEMDKIMDRMESLQYEWIEDRLRNKKAKVNDLRRRIEMGSFAAAVNEMKLALPPFAERSGMQLTANKAANADQPDPRSPIELGLCEEVWEHADEFFAGIEFRMKELGMNDSELKGEITQLRELIEELHDRNMKTINSLGVRYPEPSRKLIKRKDIEKEVCLKLEGKHVDKVSALHESGFPTRPRTRELSVSSSVQQPVNKNIEHPEVKRAENSIEVSAGLTVKEPAEVSQESMIEKSIKSTAEERVEQIAQSNMKEEMEHNIEKSVLKEQTQQRDALQIEQKAEQLVAKASQHGDQPVEQQTNQHTDQPGEQPTEQPAEQSVDQLVHQAVDQAVDQPVDRAVDKTADQPVENPVELLVAQPVETVVKDYTDQGIKESEVRQAEVSIKPALEHIMELMKIEESKPLVIHEARAHPEPTERILFVTKSRGINSAESSVESDESHHSLPPPMLPPAEEKPNEEMDASSRSEVTDIDTSGSQRDASKRSAHSIAVSTSSRISRGGSVSIGRGSDVISPAKHVSVMKDNSTSSSTDLNDRTSSSFLVSSRPPKVLSSISGRSGDTVATTVDEGKPMVDISTSSSLSRASYLLSDDDNNAATRDSKLSEARERIRAIRAKRPSILNDSNTSLDHSATSSNKASEVTARMNQLRERIAAGRSAGGDRLGTVKTDRRGASEARDRSAAIEERREKMRASILARKKAREAELAKSSGTGS